MNLRTLTKALSMAAALTVAGLFGAVSPAQAAWVCTTAPNGAEVCGDNGVGGGTGTGSGSVGNGGGNSYAPAPPAPPAPVKQAPVPALAPIQNVTPVTVTPVIPSQNATDANATEDVKPLENAPSPSPSTMNQEQAVIEPTPSVSSPSLLQPPTTAISLAESSDTKASNSSPNLSVLLGASLATVILFGATMFSRISFTRQFVKEFQSGQDS